MKPAAASTGRGGTSPEPAVYRPFALVALAATVLGGTPLGIWMQSRLYWGGGSVEAEWVLLHAHLQLFGFFGTLILGIAHHLVPRFTGRPVARTTLAPWLAAMVVGALLLRGAGVVVGVGTLVVAGALLHAATFLVFGGWLWRALDSPSLAALRRHLAVSTGWLALALLAEGLLRWQSGGLDSDPRWMRAVHFAGIFGGLTGWILGVGLRAGPMFVAGWGVPPRIARAAPWGLSLGVLLAVLGEVGPWLTAVGLALTRLGEALAMGTVAVTTVTGGVFRRSRRALTMVGRGGPETWMFRLAMTSAGAAALGSVVAALMAWHGIPLGLLADANRHVVTVGFLTGMVLAMAFRLISVLEGVPLPWPQLRAVAFWALLSGLALRSAEVLADYGLSDLLHWMPLSGALVWIALAAVALNWLSAMRARAPTEAASRVLFMR